MSGFSWSDRKRREVKNKHGIDLEDVVRVFDEPSISEDDYEHSDNEPREAILAEYQGRVVKVIFIDRGSYKFIVTAFWANDQETAMFYNDLFGYQR